MSAFKFLKNKNETHLKVGDLLTYQDHRDYNNQSYYKSIQFFGLKLKIEVLSATEMQDRQFMRELDYSFAKIMGRGHPGHIDFPVRGSKGRLWRSIEFNPA